MESLLLRACKKEANPRPPIWLMRQAGRYMPEYQAVRSKVSFLELCRNADLCAQVTLEARDRLGVDAAIIFSDILIIAESFGFKLEFTDSHGPSLTGTINNLADVQKMPVPDVRADLHFVYEALRKTRKQLPDDIALLGFCGAPFTVASYMLEGGSSRNFIKTKKFMGDHPEAFHALMEGLTQASATYLNAQIEAGADAVQIFDSWAGQLSPSQYREFVLPHSKKLISLVKGAPVIHFGAQTAGLLDCFKEVGGDVIGLDWRMDIESAWNTLGSQFGVQGNLDPVLLFSKPSVFLKETQKILEAVGDKPGFIFNLGHGILPHTPVEHVIELVEFVKNFKK